MGPRLVDRISSSAGSTNTSIDRLSHASIHSLIGQAVGLGVAGAERVIDLETIQGAGQPAGLLPKREQAWILYLVLAFHLLDHELRVGNHPQAPGAAFRR